MKDGIPKSTKPSESERVDLIVAPCKEHLNDDAFKWEIYRGGDSMFSVTDHQYVYVIVI